MGEKKKLLDQHNANESSFDVVALHYAKSAQFENKPKKKKKKVLRMLLLSEDKVDRAPAICGG